MASFTRNFVSSATNSLPDNTNETVDLETPARRATSMMVTRPTRSAASPLSVSDIYFPFFWIVLITSSKQDYRYILRLNEEICSGSLFHIGTCQNRISRPVWIV